MEADLRRTRTGGVFDVKLLGRTLDVGCGLGRNLKELETGSVGVDHNAAAVAECRRRGLTALTVEEWFEREKQPGEFDSLLVAHVLEHVTEPEGLLNAYLLWLRSGNDVCDLPQERDATATPSTCAC